MKKELFWIVGIAVICLCVAVVFAKTQSYKGTQWEYGCYSTSIITGLDNVFYWVTPTVSIFEKKDTDVWKKAGLKTDDGKLLVDWFNFLGKQGWELICIDELHSKIGLEKNYLFKRPKQP